MAANFDDLLARPKSAAERPPSVPGGEYYAKIGKITHDAAGVTPYNERVKGSTLKVPVISFKVNLVGPGPGVNPEELAKVDLARVSARLRTVDFLLGEGEYDHYYRLIDFIESFGIEIADDKGAGAYVPELQGRDCIVTVTAKHSDDGKDVFNNIAKCIGVK